jgi:hypothetical protein
MASLASLFDPIAYRGLATALAVVGVAGGANSNKLHAGRDVRTASDGRHG